MPRITSWAKMMPAMGDALIAVEIAAATPQPTQTVTVIPACRFNRATSEPKVAPRWVSGPYWPTDAPAPRDTTLVRAERNPERSGMRPSGPWTARMTSGGPSARCSGM